MKKIALASTLLIVLILACGCTDNSTSTTSDVTITQTIEQPPGVAAQTQTAAPTPTGTPVPTTVKTTVSTPVPTPSPITLSGNGQKATDFFNLEKGLVTFTLTHNGDRNFAVWLMDSDGDKKELLVNDIGSFSGSHAIGIKDAGKYLLDITADGRWTVKIEQPRYTSAKGTPRTFTGEGEKASDPFYLEKGLVRFEMTHDGDRNFAVWLLDSKGNKKDLLVNKIGEFEGSKAIKIYDSGVYLLDITADGKWKIEIT
ncbi:MAG: hypothetical protein WC340_15705 [Kiritimatiellia bacterium]